MRPCRGPYIDRLEITRSRGWQGARVCLQTVRLRPCAPTEGFAVTVPGSQGPGTVNVRALCLQAAPFRAGPGHASPRAALPPPPPRRCCPQTEGVGRCDGGPACPPRHHGAPVLTSGRGWRLLARGPGWRMHRPGHRAGASLRLRPAPSPTNPTLTPPHHLTLLRPPSTQPATNIQLGCVGRPPIPQRWSR